MKLLALAALFAVGVLSAVAAVGGAQTTETTTETVNQSTTVVETTTVEQTTTAPATTVVATVAPTTTTTGLPATTASTTSTTETSGGGTPTWVWVLVGILAAVVVGLLVALLTRRGSATLPEGERRRLLQSAVESWTAQGWALVNETADTAVLQRAGERMAVSVDSAGRVSTRRVPEPPP